MEFNFKIKQESKYCIVYLSGSLLEKNDSIELTDTLNNYLNSHNLFYILDLDRMNYINSTGLNILINILTKVRNRGGDMAVINVPKKIKQVLLITKLNSIFNVSQTIGEAERSIYNAIKQYQATN